MSKRQFKSQASSGRVGTAVGAFGNAGFGSTQSSLLSYIQEPPDYSPISDPNLVVAFKNLSKKDSTTKAKALEEIQSSWIAVNGEIEDAIVDAWVRLFPRLTIDNARRVRQLSHSLNGELCAKCGKRIAKQLPRLSGPWLAGTFDVDRAASKTAQDALAKVFPTPEKALGLRKTFHESILQYCSDAVLNETVQTLSDERAVSREDAEATYARVVSSALTVVNSLLETLPTDEIEKQSHQYETILNDGKFWDLPSHTDASVRRAAHRLVRTCLRLRPNLVANNVKAVSKAYIYKGLTADQTGSAIDFAQTLDALTSSHAAVWTDAYSGKKTAISRLQQCLKRGAQTGPGNYWSIMADIFRRLPQQTLPVVTDSITDLLVAARDGVARKEERFNASSAWPAYFTLVDIVTERLPAEDAETVLEAFAMPPVNQYLYPSDDNVRWGITGAKAASTVARVASIKRMPHLLDQNWPHLAAKLIELAKTSQPEQSKDYDRSQRHVASTGERWAALQRELFSDAYNLPDNVRRSSLTANAEILKECIVLLRTRNGKPYGAAAIIEEQMRACASLLLQYPAYKDELCTFVAGSMTTLIFSPSQRHLPRCLYALSEESEFEELFTNVLNTTLESERSENETIKALRALFVLNTPPIAIGLAKASPLLQKFFSTLELRQNETQAADLFGDVLKLGVAAQDTVALVLSRLTQELSFGGQESRDSLDVLERLTTTNSNAVQSFLQSDNGKSLLSSVLHLEQSSDDDVAERATTVSGKMSSALGSAATGAKFDLIMQNLEHVSRTSLSIQALLELTEKIMPTDDRSMDLKDSLPNVDVWHRAVLSIMAPPKSSLSILSTLGGAVNFVEDTVTDTASGAQFDDEGISQALRIAIYVAEVMDRPNAISQLGGDAAKVLALLNICVLLAEDNNSVLGTNGLWMPARHTAEDEVMDFISNANSILKKYWDSLPPSSAQLESAAILSAMDELRHPSGDSSAMAYYAILASAKACENIFELHGYSTEQSAAAEVNFKAQKADKNPLIISSFLVSRAQPLTGSQSVNRFCNELIADLTDISIDSEQSKAIELLVLLNAILRTQDDIAASVQKTRLVFFVKRIISWFESEASPTLKSEVCRTLTSLTPSIADMYGEHWTKMLDFLSTFWNSADGLVDSSVVSESGILLTHASLRLYGALHRLSQADDPNDDLLESLKESQDHLYSGLISLLKSQNGVTDEFHQPLLVTNELLARTLARVPFKPISEVEELFSLLSAPSHAIQSAAFDLLHKHIPAAQERISFDAALDDKKAALPDELLSLILEAPLDNLADTSFDRVMPASLQGYLFSWRLLFDHFQGSSFRVKSDYVEQIKEGGYLPNLLDLIFDLLGHTRGKPIDASKFDVQEYVPNTEPSPERDVQWLLSHLFYLALLNLPSSVKSYFLDVRSRQTSQAIESWTSKYISPFIITASLQAVADWSEKSVKEDPDYESMTVKVGMRSREINVSYLVDEQTMAIKIELPATYPLDSAKVLSVNRVAVKEEKWNSWLRNCQGVITFSNGSITDGLSAWRKNVTGALKGQTECAICYSIISGDKQLPTKRCPTCKNLFHSSCLFKWFKTSNASTCPLCRNPFNFN